MDEQAFIERLTRLEETSKHREAQLDELLKEVKELRKEWQRAKGAWWMFIFLGGGLASAAHFALKLWRV
ncbi:MAG: hypothetical protein ACK5LE_06885 [Alphaproteobacteria bacterium]